MLKFRSRQFVTLLGLFVLAGMLAAAVAVGTCGGEEEEAGVELKPTELIFKKTGETKTITITNIGSKSVKLKNISVGSKAFKPFKTCEGVTLEPKGSPCTETVECVETEPDAYFTLQTEPPVTANAVLLKC
jgi:hypothetical protein